MEISKLIYKKEKNIYNIRILGETFVKNNRNKGKLIINNKKSRLKDIIPISIIKENIENIIKIKMILNKHIFNFSCMFKDCSSLKSITKFLFINDIENYISEENNNKEEYSEETIKNDEESSSTVKPKTNKFLTFFSVFFESTISEMSKIDEDYSHSTNSELLDNILKNFSIKKYIIIKEIFYNCKSLIILPDISNWNTENVIDMSRMFYNCESLTSMPDISKWNTHNVIDMKYMFYNCKSLKSLPDISKWNTNTDLTGLSVNKKFLNNMKDSNLMGLDHLS